MATAEHFVFTTEGELEDLQEMISTQDNPSGTIDKVFKQQDCVELKTEPDETEGELKDLQEMISTQDIPSGTIDEVFKQQDCVELKTEPDETEGKLKDLQEMISTPDIPSGTIDEVFKQQDCVELKREPDGLEEIKETLSTHDLPTAFNIIKRRLEEQHDAKLNIAVTGESGSGKSTFVNGFRGLGEEDKDSAQTGVVETTKKPEVYSHPQFKNVKVWDLPGIGTPNFKAHEYLEQVQFEKYDFFIIISSDRFKECHTQLAEEIKNTGKRFYFVRSKIDFSITAEKRKKNFDRKKTLDAIRKDCENGLRKIGIEDPVVFLVSGWEFGKYDINPLQERLQKELPKHKRHMLMLALPNITMEINEKKRKALEANVAKVAFASAVAAAVPLPGLSVAVDLAIITGELRKYYNVFSLDDESLERLCEKSGKTIEELKSLMKSPLHQDINSSSILTMLGSASRLISEESVKYFVSLIPIIGTVTAGGLSYMTVSRMLRRALDGLADDARKVLIASVQTEEDM